jgi:pyruvate dehydrogenase E1 component beta subunit
MVQMTYRDALKLALSDAMKEDDNVFILGEEVGKYGGAYGVTKGLLEDFGTDRVLDTPISEPAIIGTAVGAAMSGMRPVVELMYVDFLGMTMDQLGNQAAKMLEPSSSNLTSSCSSHQRTSITSSGFCTH